MRLYDEQRIVLSDVSFSVPSPGVLCLVGPGKSGKSSLLAALANVESALGSGLVSLDRRALTPATSKVVWVRQHARLQGGQSLGERLRIDFGLMPARVATELKALAMQHADFAALTLDTCVERLSASVARLLAILAGVWQDADLLLLDEPSVGLDAAHVDIAHRAIRQSATRSMVVLATHNRRDCLALGGHTALLAGGVVQECAPSEQFFSTPATAAGRIYVETGNCNVALASTISRPRDGMWWVVPGLLCGMSRPGLVSDAETQYEKLRERGVQRLICLEEQYSYPTSSLRQRGIAHHHFGMPDMAPPSFDQALTLCRLLEQPIRANEGVAVHCRGGLGRTGTVLAAVLIWFGDAADAAITQVRNAQPFAIQSGAQSRFLHQFAERIHGWH